MKNIKNFDGISKPKKVSLNQQQKTLKIDGIVKRPAKKTAVRTVLSPFFVVPGKTKTKKAATDLFFRKFYSQKKVSMATAVFGLIITFVFGMWAMMGVKSSVADTQPQVLGASTNEPSADRPGLSGSPIAGTQLQSQDGGNINNDVLFNTPIEYLQSYFQSASEPDIINRRKNQLEGFLTNMNSPLAQASETIAEQDHWQLILAITFAESTLGKNCADNNCSNIGVKPGASSWRSYASYSAWVVDFNRLLDKKYKDWTLEQMCGVYVKPCNPNWLLATKQILSALKEQNIE